MTNVKMRVSTKFCNIPEQSKQLDGHKGGKADVL